MTAQELREAMAAEHRRLARLHDECAELFESRAPMPAAVEALALKNEAIGAAHARATGHMRELAAAIRRATFGPSREA